MVLLFLLLKWNYFETIEFWLNGLYLYTHYVIFEMIKYVHPMKTCCRFRQNICNMRESTILQLLIGSVNLCCSCLHFCVYPNLKWDVVTGQTPTRLYCITIHVDHVPLIGWYVKYLIVSLLLLLCRGYMILSQN